MPRWCNALAELCRRRRARKMSEIIADERLARLLAGTELFGHLPRADQAACARKFRALYCNTGHILFARGDPGTQRYLIAEGRVRLAIGTADGQSHAPLCDQVELGAGVAASEQD